MAATDRDEFIDVTVPSILIYLLTYLLIYYLCLYVNYQSCETVAGCLCDGGCRTMTVKAAEETEVDWGQLKKMTAEGEEAAVVEEAVQLKKVEQEESAQMQLGPRRQSVLVRCISLDDFP